MSDKYIADVANSYTDEMIESAKIVAAKSEK